MKNKIINKLKEETISAIPAIVYFLLMFNLIHFMADMARQPGDTKYFTYLTITIGALIVGKVIVIVNCFSFLNAYPLKPMIYNITWKLFIYMLCINLICLLHISIHLFIKLKDFRPVFDRLMFDVSLPIFWSTELCLGLIFLSYIIFSEFVRVLGKKTVVNLLFGL